MLLLTIPLRISFFIIFLFEKDRSPLQFDVAMDR